MCVFVCVFVCTCVYMGVNVYLGKLDIVIEMLSFSSLYMVYIDCLIFQSDQKSLYDPICSAVLNVPTYLIH